MCGRLQQNHDRLAQKAGFPQTKLNEIHGAWVSAQRSTVLWTLCITAHYSAHNVSHYSSHSVAPHTILDTAYHCTLLFT